MAGADAQETPQYVRIAADIRNKIRTGELRPGDLVPSAPQLCKIYAVSMITAKSALNLLKSEGAVFAVSGKGTYVSDNTRIIRTAPQRYFRGGARTYVQDTERAGLQPMVSHETAVVPATNWVAQRLEINEGDEVTATSYRISIDGHRVAMSVSWEPLAITRATPIEFPHEGPLGSKGLNTRFQSIGWNIEQVEEHILVRNPSPEEESQLSLPPNTPVVELQQTVRASRDSETYLVPIEAADVIYAANRYEFHYVMDRPN